jgi:hypothetical protein
MIFLSFYFLLGYVSLFVILLLMQDVENKQVGFYLSLIPSFIMGTGSALGEAILLGYLRNFPKHLMSGWGSGTGLAGLFGALLTLVFKLFNIKTHYLYISVSPICLIYLGSFIYIERIRKE